MRSVRSRSHIAVFAARIVPGERRVGKAGADSATASVIKRPRIIDRELLARHSGTVAGFVGSETWITRYLSG